MKKLIFSVIALFLSTMILHAAEEKSAESYMADLDAGKDEKIIVKAAEWLGKKEEKDAIPKLIKLLDDDRENVRSEATVALGYIGEETAVEALNKVLLNDESANVRYAAFLATLRIGSKKSIETWKKAKETETDPFIKDLLKKMEEKIKGE
ncbi:MAG: HEAT repeat domain-containing protein [bacterium]|nr:HEAT repeat domain-containing protein [bacterium]